MIKRGRSASRPARPPGDAGGGWMGMGGPPAGKTQNVGKTLRQLLGRLRPGAAAASSSSRCSASASVAFSVVGPKILGNATNIIFNGVVGKIAAGRADQGAGDRGPARARPESDRRSCCRA